MSATPTAEFVERSSRASVSARLGFVASSDRSSSRQAMSRSSASRSVRAAVAHVAGVGAGDGVGTGDGVALVTGVADGVGDGVGVGEGVGVGAAVGGPSLAGGSSIDAWAMGLACGPRTVPVQTEASAPRTSRTIRPMEMTSGLRVSASRERGG